MKKLLLYLSLIVFIATSCSKDDEEIAVENIELSSEQESIYLMSGKTLPSLTATVSPASATDKTVTWSSDSPDIISVDQTTGKLTFVNSGIETTVIIKAQSGTKTATCTIEIINNFAELAVEGYGFIDATTELGMYLMDRNVGATVVYNKTDNPVASIGNYYQWGKNTPVATGDGALNSNFDKEWNATGASFKDWNVAANTPCPAGWSIPNQAQMKEITDKAWADYDWDTQTDEEFEAAKALYAKLLIARGGYWRIQGATADERATAIPNKYLATAGYWWSSELNTSAGASARGFSRSYTLSDNYDIIMGKTGGETEVSNAMPVRCIKIAPN